MGFDNMNVSPKTQTVHTHRRGGQTFITNKEGAIIFTSAEGGDKHFYVVVGDIDETLDVSHVNIHMNELRKLSTGVRILSGK